MDRRTFTLACGASLGAQAQGPDRPNILWITCEDTGPQLGCYGDSYAKTPNLDALAARGARYRMAWSNAPVCAPARTTIISGMYPTSTGSEHMRSEVKLPEGMRMYPWYLREAGYYTTNNSKEDYNLQHTGTVWDQSSPKAHWRNRKPGQPFFAIFNFVTTHESQIWPKGSGATEHDPAKARVPAYHPDTPEVRRDWAQYYDNITRMDGQAAEVLKQLEQDGLADSTVVFFYGDHGPGMPRSKRWPYNSGLQVPLIVHVPAKFKHLAPAGYKEGGELDRLVSFVDLGPTAISLAGLKPPAHMQGRAFMGSHTAPAPKMLFGFRGRMDERIDCVRTATDGRYVYVRHFMPHKPYGQHIAYMFNMPTTQVWKKQYDAGQLKPPRTFFWETKPAEELYDLQSDRDEVNNLASAPAHRETLLRMRKAVHEHMVSTRDIGVLPECEVLARSTDGAPYNTARDPKRYPAERVIETAEIASMRAPADVKTLTKRLTDPDSGVRYWAVLGMQMQGAGAVKEAREAIRRLLNDASAAPKIAAAETLGLYGEAEDLPDALRVLGEMAPAGRNGSAVSILAMNAISSLGRKAQPLKETIQSMDARDPKSPQRLQEYPNRLVKTLAADLS
jgi:arylsulfatase A-like enzyme